MKIKLSKYTIFNVISGKVVIYNSLTGAILRLFDQGMIDQFFHIKDKVIVYNENDILHKTLFDNGIIVDVEIDELLVAINQYEQSIASSRVLKLFPIVTRQCNFRCVYCYEEHRDEHMSLEVFRSINKWIDKVFKHRAYNEVHVSFFGGEPLVRYDGIVDFLEHFSSLKDKYPDIKESAGMTTNGYLLTAERFLKLHELGIKNYQITIDGIEATHNSTRPLRGGQGSWGQIIDNLKSIQRTDKDFDIIIRTNYNYDILDQQAEFIEFLSETFDNRFSIYFESIKKLGGSNDDSLNVLEPLEEIVATGEMIDVVNRLNLKNTTYEAFTKPIGRVCYAAEPSSFVVDYDGSLKKCTLALDDPKNMVGHLNEEGDVTIDRKKHAQWVSNSFINREKCLECNVLPNCYGKKCPKGYVINGQKELVCDLDELMIMQIATRMHNR